MIQPAAIDYPTLLEAILTEVQAMPLSGRPAQYIPALAEVDPSRFAFSVSTLDGRSFSVGDSSIPFSVQSISKVFAAAMVLQEKDIHLWERVGVEPSGTKFNSLIQLELEHGIPRNPFINAGAIVVADELLALYPDPKVALLNQLRYLAADATVSYDPVVARSEKETGHGNLALAHFLKANGNLHHPVDEVLDLYFHLCALAMSTDALARVFLFLANNGVVPGTGERLLGVSETKRLNSLMLTCGFYDQAGEFAYKVGLPGKSGVGGGIAAVVPGVLSLAVWSPPLNDQGNSVRGIQALVRFTDETGFSVF